MVRAVAIGEDEVYLFEVDNVERMNELLEFWYTLYDEYFERCGEIFKLLFRKEFEIPLDATMKEEAAFLVDNFGSPPSINSGFMERLLTVQTEYEGLIGSPPNFAEFAFKNEVELERVTVTVDI